jgi:hypothetical protein
MPTERRSAPRQKSFIRGLVFFNRRQSTIDCTIREFSRTGARLAVSDLALLPAAYEVYIPSKNEYFKANTKWHRGNEVGVAWVPEEIPHSLVEGYQPTASLGDRVTKLEHEVAALRKRLDALQG